MPKSASSIAKRHSHREERLRARSIKGQHMIRNCDVRRFFREIGVRHYSKRCMPEILACVTTALLYDPVYKVAQLGMHRSKKERYTVTARDMKYMFKLTGQRLYSGEDEIEEVSEKPKTKHELNCSECKERKKKKGEKLREYIKKKKEKEQVEDEPQKDMEEDEIEVEDESLSKSDE